MRILVVEDNPSLAAQLQKGLGEQGYAPDLCASGYEAEDLAVAEPYAAIILDLMLPDRDGLDLCKSLRRRNISIPVLMLTGLSETDQKIQGLDAGADDYLTKPFEFDELVARLRALLRRGQSGEVSKLTYGDLELDLYQREASRGGESITLSGKEFTLLEYLMRNPNRVLPRTQILASVWDMNYEPTSNVVDVYISALRRKIDRPFPSLLIHTVPGTGYRFGDKASKSASDHSDSLSATPGAE